LKFEYLYAFCIFNHIVLVEKHLTNFS
jgi:hypothetical protein